MYETYELRLDHYIVDQDGDRHLLDEPLVVRMVNDRRYAQTVSICINNMIDRMRDEMLKRVGEE